MDIMSSGKHRIFSIIRNLCGSDCLHLPSKYVSLIESDVRHRGRLHFSHRCLDNEVLPKSLRLILLKTHVLVESWEENVDFSM